LGGARADYKLCQRQEAPLAPKTRGKRHLIVKGFRGAGDAAQDRDYQKKGESSRRRRVPDFPFPEVRNRSHTAESDVCESAWEKEFPKGTPKRRGALLYNESSERTPLNEAEMNAAGWGGMIVVKGTSLERTEGIRKRNVNLPRG